MTTSTTFWDKAAAKYEKSAISDMDGYRDTLDRTIRHLKPTDRVLELGCGTASTVLQLAGHVAHLTATDISPAMIEIGRAKVAEAGVTNVTLRVGTASDADVDAPYDAVLALNLLHLLPDQDAALRQIHAALKPGGLFISKTACLGEKWFFKPLVTLLSWLGKAPFVTHQRQAALRAAILGAGFEGVEELSQPGTPPRLYMVVRRV